MRLQRGKVCKIGNVRQADHRDVDRLSRRPFRKAGGEGILVVDPYRQKRHNAEHRDPGQAFQLPEAGAQKRLVAAELVDDKAPDPGTLALIQQHHRAVQLGKDPAAVDIPREQHRRIHQLCQAHVHDVVFTQIDLRRAARSLDHDHVVLFGKAFIGRQDFRDQLLPVRKIVRRRHLRAHPAVDDDLASDIAGGFEQDRIHAHIRLDARGLGLHGLGTPDLAQLGRDIAVEGHVLALKGRRAQTVLPEDPAERRAQQALARARHAALHHDAFCPAHVRTSLSAAIRRPFSSSVRTAQRYQLSSRP